MLVVFFGSGDVLGGGSFLEKNGYDKEPNGDFRGSFDPSLQKKNTNWYLTVISHDRKC